MGINDRDYGRYGYGEKYGYNDEPGVHLGAPDSVTVKIIIVTFIVYVLQIVADPWFTETFGLHANWFRQPWRFFELLTYGFLHSTTDLRHIIFNMITLFFLGCGFQGAGVEGRYGKREYLAIYLLAIVFSGLVWDAATAIETGGGNRMAVPMAIGASGAISALLLLFIVNFPNVTLMVFGVFPAKAWVIGSVLMAIDVFGAVNRDPDDHVAYTAHLGGFLFGFLYYKSGIRLTRYLPSGLKMPSFKRRPPLRVHQPSEEDKDERNERRLDELLEKVATGGQESLSSAERRELQKLSKYYQEKRR